MIKINIKPLSVNQAWQWKRFKTRLYEDYEYELFYQLPNIKLPEWDLMLEIEAWISSASDIDNIIKPTLDILSKKYWFNDNKILYLIAHKVIVKKGDEYISFKFNSYPC